MAMKRKSSNGPGKRRRREHPSKEEQLFEGIGRMGEEAPARFLFKGQAYEFQNSGAYGFVYREVPNSLTAIKIMYRREFHPVDEFVAAAEQEVRLQKQAAAFNLAPQIYASGFIPESDFYFVQMDFYDEENGWKHVFAGYDGMQAIFCEFIRRLVFEAGLYNPDDPYAHFYFHPRLGLRMIDYGKCQEVEPREEQLRYQNMIDALELDCPQALAGGRTKKRTKNKRTTKKRTTKKRTTKKRTTKKRTTKKRTKKTRRTHRRSRFKSNRRIHSQTT